VRRALATLARLLPDVEPLRRHRDFRIILCGQLVNNMGSFMTDLALPYQLYLLTHSVLALGALAMVQFGAALTFAAVGGAIADAMDRRRLLLVTQLGLCSVSITLACLALSGRAQAWMLFGLAFLAAMFSSVDRPTRHSLVPRLVSPALLRQGIALHQSLNQTTKVLGPALAGAVIAVFGVTAAYGIDVLTFVAGLAALLSIASIPPSQAPVGSALAVLAEGLRYVRRTPVVLSGFVLDLDAMVFGMPQSLFPVLALDVFHAGPQGLGILTAAPAIGGVIGAATLGWARHLRYPGRVVFGAVTAWGVAICLFGLAPWFPLAVFLLAVAGLANSVGATMRWTITQTITPDHLRGRVSALSTIVLGGGPKLGDLEAAAVASVATPQVSIVSGGLLCLAGVLFVLRYFPALARYDAWAGAEAALAPEPQPAAAVALA
jgi:MFS family permease